MRRLAAMMLVAVLLLGAMPASVAQSRDVFPMKSSVAQPFPGFLPSVIAKGTRLKLTKVARIKLEEKTQLTVKVLPAGTLCKLTWSVEAQSNVVAVDQSGMVTGMNVGTAYVRVTDELSGLFARCKVVVSPVYPESIMPSAASLMVEIGESSEPLGILFKPSNVTDKTVAWSSRNPSIAKVDEHTGVVTGVSAGTVQIDARSNGLRADLKVTVVDKSVKFTLSAVGDVVLGGDPRPEKTVENALKRNTYETFKRFISTQGISYPFKNVASVLRKDDFTIANLECVLSNNWQTLRQSKKPHVLVYEATEGGQILRDGSVEFCSLGNNHTHDLGDGGYGDTKRALDAVGIGYAQAFGTGVYTIEKDGVKVKIGVTSFQTPLVSQNPVSKMKGKIHRLRRTCDLVIACFHWCDTPEWTTKVYPSDRAVAHIAVKAGADLVLGSHRHVPAGIERYKSAYIVYDLANFVAGIKHKTNHDSLIFQWDFRADSSGTICDEGIRVIPCTTTTSTETYHPDPTNKDEMSFGDEGAPICNWQPAIVTGAEARRVISAIQSMSNIPIPMGDGKESS